MGSKGPVLDLDLVLEEPCQYTQQSQVGLDGQKPPDLQTLLSDQESVHKSSAALWVQRLLCTSEEA